MTHPTYTTHFKDRTSSTTGEEPSYLIEVTHPQLAQPIRIVNDAQDLVSNGNTFSACGFRVQFPDDVQGSMPRVPCSVDNIGRELTQWLEASNGGKGAQFKIMQVMRDTPNVIEQSYTMTLINAKQDMIKISGTLGYENLLDQPILAATYNLSTTPGLFP